MKYKDKKELNNWIRKGYTILGYNSFIEESYVMLDNNSNKKRFTLKRFTLQSEATGQYVPITKEQNDYLKKKIKNKKRINN